MKRSLLASFLLMAVTVGTITPARAWWPVVLWSHSYGSATYQDCQSVAADAAGNVFMTGYFVGTVNFGGSDLNSPLGVDVYLVKFNSSGVHQWSKCFGVSGNHYGQAVATDASGAVYVAGYFDGAMNFGGGAVVSAGGEDVFVAKFNAAGTYQWGMRFGDATDQFCYSVAADAAGDVYLPCTFNGTIDFGDGALTSAGGTDIALARFWFTGGVVWSQRFGDANAQYAYSAATDASGNVYLGGHFMGAVDFGGGTLTSVGGTDVCLAKFNAAGTHQWSKRFGSPVSQYLQCVATDNSSNVFITGHYFGGINFGLGPMPSAGNDDIYLAKFDAAGTPTWSKRFGDASANQYGYALATDPSGSVYLAGYTQGTVNFGGVDLLAAGGDDAYIAKFNATGAHQWSRRFGDASDQRAYAAAVDGRNAAYLAGSLVGSADFGTGTLTSAGSSDVFLSKYSAFADIPVISSITDVGNDQGRVAHVTFARSFDDAAGAATPITSYVVFRRDDLAPSASALAAHDPAGLPARARRDAGWTEVGSVGAFGKNAYGIDVPTIGDSTITLGQYYSVFFVRAATATTTTFFDSPPDSGYSRDNLAPGSPAGVRYSVGQLAWYASTSKDFDYFSVYGSNTDSFASATLIGYTIGTSMDVHAAPRVFYYITATDFSGNEGKPATVNTLTGAGGTPTSYVLSISAYPNPFNPSTTIRYTVPSRGRVDVDVFDPRGERVVTLFHGERGTGAYQVQWDGRAAGGVPVSSGVYFARVSHASQTKSYKLLLLK